MALNTYELAVARVSQWYFFELKNAPKHQKMHNRHEGAYNYYVDRHTFSGYLLSAKSVGNLLNKLSFAV